MTDHYDQAETLLVAVPDSATASPQLATALAQVHATLALVDALEHLRSDYAAWESLR